MPHKLRFPTNVEEYNYQNVMKWKTKTNDAFENIRRYNLLNFLKFLLITSLDIYNFETDVNRSPWIDKIKLFSCSLSMLDHSHSGIRSHTSCLICSVVLEWQLFLNAFHININAFFCQHVFRVTHGTSKTIIFWFET